VICPTSQQPAEKHAEIKEEERDPHESEVADQPMINFKQK
jgi:hypothetical protein